MMTAPHVIEPSFLHGQLKQPWFDGGASIRAACHGIVWGLTIEPPRIWERIMGVWFKSKLLFGNVGGVSVWSWSRGQDAFSAAIVYFFRLWFSLHISQYRTSAYNNVSFIVNDHIPPIVSCPRLLDPLRRSLIPIWILFPPLTSVDPCTFDTYKDQY